MNIYAIIKNINNNINLLGIIIIYILDKYLLQT